MCRLLEFLEFSQLQAARLHDDGLLTSGYPFGVPVAIHLKLRGLKPQLQPPTGA